MKRLTIVSLVLFAIVLGGIGSAQATFDFYFDESGNGYYIQNGGPATTSLGTLQPNPFLGGTGLMFNLPETVSVGGIRIFENALSSVLSDALYFNNSAASGLGLMWFYSIAPSNGAAPSRADTGIPDTLFSNLNDNGGVIEVNGVLDWYPGGNTYHAYSDSPVPPPVPLPGAVWLLGPGLVGLAAVRRRFKN